jgi:hypothetical protein
MVKEDLYEKYNKDLVDTLIDRYNSVKLVKVILDNNQYEFYPNMKMETISKEIGNKVIEDDGIKHQFNTKGVNDTVLTHLYTIGFRNTKNGILRILRK